MRTLVSAAVLAAALALAAPTLAQSPPTGGPDAKGNAPLKDAHTVNDGAAKRARNSFTQAQARKHIEKSGFADVSPLTKGADGVWRGTATKNGGPVEVGLDFKGNVVVGGGTASATPAPMPMPMPAPAMAGAGSSSSSSSSTTTTSSDAGAAGAMATGGAMHHGVRHHRRHHRAHARCAHPGPNGAACSGIDRNKNGISDKEDRAISKGAKP